MDTAPTHLFDDEKPRLLLVDDEPRLLSSLYELLRPFDYNTFIFLSAEALIVIGQILSAVQKITKH